MSILNYFFNYCQINLVNHLGMIEVREPSFLEMVGFYVLLFLLCLPFLLLILLIAYIIIKIKNKKAKIITRSEKILKKLLIVMFSILVLFLFYILVLNI